MSTFLVAICRAQAQGPPADASLDLAFIQQFEADLDGGDAAFRRTQLQSGFRQSRSLNGGRSAGFGIDYGFEGYDFSGNFDDPWDNVHKVGFSMSLRTPLTGRWSAMINPSVNLAGESGTSWDRAVVGGGVAAVSGQFGSRLVAGLGVGAFTGLEDTRFTPVVVVQWQITERWLLGNPFRPGPAGPAGLELSYQPDSVWSAGAGGVFRRDRFRLDDEGLARNGIGDVEGIVTFARISRAWSGGVSANLYGGVLLNGQLTVEDEDGLRLSQQDFDPAPLVAISVRTRW
jgi:hypothetical protein